MRRTSRFQLIEEVAGAGGERDWGYGYFEVPYPTLDTNVGVVGEDIAILFDIVSIVGTYGFWWDVIARRDFCFVGGVSAGHGDRGGGVAGMYRQLSCDAAAEYQLKEQEIVLYELYRRWRKGNGI